MTTEYGDLITLLTQRGEYEEQILSAIRSAYQAGDKDQVFVLAGKLLFEGPGTLSPTDPTKKKGKGGKHV